jgi:MerR family regulatory protein
MKNSRQKALTRSSKRVSSGSDARPTDDLPRARASTAMNSSKEISKQKLERAAKILGLSLKVLMSRLYPPILPQPPEIVRIGEAAKILGVSVTSIIRWEEQGLLHTLYRDPGKGRRFLRSTLEAFRDERQVGNSPKASTKTRKSGKLTPRRKNFDA